MAFTPQYGKKLVFKRNIFQPVLSKCSSKAQSELFTQELKSLDAKCIWLCIVSRTQDYEYSYEEEEGAGLKLASLLKRMAITNIIIGVRLWPDVSLPQHDIFRTMVNCSKELLIEFITPKDSQVQVSPQPKRTTLIELESIQVDRKRNISFDSLNKNSSNRIPVSLAKSKLTVILNKLNESDIKALQDLGNHAVIGKLLLVLMTLLQKQKPDLRSTRQFFAQNNIKDLMSKLEPATLTKLQIARASKMMKKLEPYADSYFEKISKTAVFLLNFIKCVLNSDYSLPYLPSVQKSLLVNKGEYLKPKFVRFMQMAFGSGKEIVPEEIPEIKESEPTPEPEGIEKLKDLRNRKVVGNEEGEDREEEMDQVYVDDRFRMARKNRIEENALINRLICLDPDEIDPEVKIEFELKEEDVIKFLATEDLESHPTDLLMKLAARLKERRERLC